MNENYGIGQASTNLKTEKRKQKTLLNQDSKKHEGNKLNPSILPIPIE